MAVVLAAIVLAVPTPCVSATGAPDPTAPPATLSPLDPIRLASDFAPEAPALSPDILFDFSSAEPTAEPADSLPPVMRRLQTEFAFEEDLRPKSDGGSPSVVAPAVCSLLGGVAGFYVGAVAGDAIGGSSSGSGDWEQYGAATLGATVGEVFLMPLGAHFGNGSRGSYGSALVGSVLGLGALLRLGTLGPAGAIVGLGVQTALTVSGERRSAERKSAERAARALPASAASVTLP